MTKTTNHQDSHQPTPDKRRSLSPMVWIIVISLAPVVLALLAYFVPGLGLTPSGHTNYGALVEPQRPMPDAQALPLVDLDGHPADLNDLRGKWLLVTAGPSACPETCVRRLFIMRNSHASQGKDVERLARVWFVLDDGEIDETILEAYRGTHMLRVNPLDLDKFLTHDTLSPSGTETSSDTADTGDQPWYEQSLQPMWIIDPLGNLMMEFEPDAEPTRVRDDIRKLLRNSRIG